MDRAFAFGSARRPRGAVCSAVLVWALLPLLSAGCGSDAPAPAEPRGRGAIERAKEAHAGGIRAPARPADPSAPDEGLAAPGASREERAARVEALCRTLVYTAREGMSEGEGAEFAREALGLSNEELDRDRTRSPSVGAARNGALDRLGVPRYGGCEGGG